MKKTPHSASIDGHSLQRHPAIHFTLIELLVNTTCKIYNHSTTAALRKREGRGERKRRPAPRFSPYQTLSTSRTLPASSHASANALQAASRSKNVKLFFRRKAGRQLHVIADLPSPPADRASACRPPRTRHRHLAGRRGRGGRRIRPPHAAI